MVISIDQSTTNNRLKPVMTTGLVNTHIDRSIANPGLVYNILLLSFNKIFYENNIVSISAFLVLVSPPYCSLIIQEKKKKLKHLLTRRKT